MSQKFSIIIPSNLLSVPGKREVSAAWLLTKFFQKDVELVNRSVHKTADFLIDQKYWELKSIEGNGKRTIQHALHRAAKQSDNVIIDARFAKMNIRQIRSQASHHFRYIPKLKRLLLIEKDGKILEIFK